MEYHETVLCMTREELTGGTEPIMCVNTLNSLIQRKRIQVMNRGGGACNRALYSYPSLPRK